MTFRPSRNTDQGVTLNCEPMCGKHKGEAKAEVFKHVNTQFTE